MFFTSTSMVRLYWKFYTCGCLVTSCLVRCWICDREVVGSTPGGSLSSGYDWMGGKHSG